MTESRLHEPLVITRVFDAPPSLVFDAWTQPEHMKKWWGPHHYDVPEYEADLRQGGSYRYGMRGPDGTVMWVPGTFHEFSPPSRIVTQSGVEGPDGSLLFEVRHIVDFEEIEGGKTRLRMESEVLKLNDPAWQAGIDGMEEGTTQMLEKLDSYLLSQVRGIRASRTFQAPVELVFEVWTDPKHVSEWWGPRGFSTTTTEFNLEAGGVWRFTMHGPDGTDYPNKVTFLEVNPPHLLRYHHSDDKDPADIQFEATVRFDSRSPETTEVTLQTIFETAAFRDKLAAEVGAVEGAHDTLARFGEMLEKINNETR